jgi:hypothetical protein
VRPESITAIVLALIPVSVLMAVGFVAAVLWLGSPSSEPLENAGSRPVQSSVAGTAAAVAPVPYTPPVR